MNVIVSQINNVGSALTRVLRKRLIVASQLLGKRYHEDIEVAVVLADDGYLRKLNRRYRGLDIPTDVLSFGMLEQDELEQGRSGEAGPMTIGDIYISLDQARDQAVAAGRPLEQEVLILAIHGLLHLCGYDHHSDSAAKAMEQKEAELFKKAMENPVNKNAIEQLNHSFRNAFSGLHYSFGSQRNMVIHLAAGVVAIVLAFLFRLEASKFFFVLSAVFAVLTAEVINTAIEMTVDLATKEQHKLAQIAKDVAAGAVLLTTFYAVIVGLSVLAPPLWEILKELIHF